ncbi:cell division protein FtsK [Microlunatus elymi]|uniref:Cell division protein FtsK n=1 Tax=Microlunatus elymi TaxID=2596828 RepID=A0A516PV26_9ACTN|nr:FtsK/SpoIIIE domain-containing protein [Microlunatus elymi]QDP94990.1 cell division protein FtsK [Microlunatus elymi]
MRRLVVRIGPIRREPAWLVVTLAVCRVVSRGARRLARAPFGVLAVVALAGWAVLLTVYGWRWWQLGPTVVVVLLGWRWLWPSGFGRVLGLPLRSVRRGGRIYRRQWSSAMDASGLVRVTEQARQVPRLVRVRSSRSVDRVTVEMLPGQVLDDFAGVADRLAQTFGALDCRVHSVPRRPHRLELWMLIKEPLEQIVEPFPTTVDDLTRGIPVARSEDGQVHRLVIVGSHVLVVGATGSGKGSVVWSLLVGLRPAITAGLVRVWAIDPKGGMELSLGVGLFDRFCHGDATSASYEEAFAVLLDDAVTVMRQRQDLLRGVTRLHEPSVDEPLLIIVIDELAALSGWVADRTLKKRIETALGLLLSQGRAVGVVVLGAVQDPRKEVLPMRDLFPTRIALRVSEAEQVGLVLGQGARARGAFADRIPERLPGVGYVVVDGIAEPRRVRFFYVTDDRIVEAGRQHAASVDASEVAA